LFSDENSAGIKVNQRSSSRTPEVGGFTSTRTKIKQKSRGEEAKFLESGLLLDERVENAAAGKAKKRIR